MLARMAISQQKLREIVFQLIYSEDFTKNETEDLLPFLMGHHEMSKKNFFLAEQKKVALVQKLEAIDAQISEVSEGYKFDRIPKIEKNILRLAVFELCYLKEEIPPKVAISEAIRLSRKFSTPESGTFVNAILDAIYKKTYAV